MKNKLTNNGMMMAGSGTASATGANALGGGLIGSNGGGGTSTNQSKEFPNIQTRSLNSGQHLPPANGIQQPGSLNGQ